jgi:hypothetical protein
MTEMQRTGFSERLKAAADAKKAMLANFRPKPTVTAPQAPDRTALRAAELNRVREGRAEEKRARKQALADVQAAAAQAEEALAAAALEAKRGERKERKEREALTQAEAKARRDARYAARKARR